MKILLATPLYPPEIGGPAQYAFHLKEEFIKMGHEVRVATFKFERQLPFFIRHIYFFFKILPNIFWADKIISFDAISVGFPTAVACYILNKKYVLRLGGDFLWESYVESASEEISLEDFYKIKRDFSFKQKLIKLAFNFSIKNTEKVVINSEWLGGIISSYYSLSSYKIVYIENYFGKINTDINSDNNQIVSSCRNIKLKNLKKLKNSISEIKDKIKGISLFDKEVEHNDLKSVIKSSHAVAVVSFSEVNPNLVFDGLSLGKPFILTKYNGLNSRFNDMGILVDPFDQKSIEEAILKIYDPLTYNMLCKNIKECKYSHSWEEIANKFEKLII